MFRANAQAPWQPTEPPTPAAWEWVAAIAVVVMMTGALIMPIFSPEPGVETPELRFIWLPIYAVIVGLVIRRAREIAALWPAVLISGALTALAFVSSRWSLEPDVTVRRSIALAMSMLFALYLAAAWRGPVLLRMLCWAFLLMGLTSIAIIFAWPEMGVSQAANAGTWRGVWTEKNQTGMMMLIAILAGLALLVSGGRGRWLAAATIAVSLIVLLGSQSKTSLLCLLAGGGLILGFHALRKAGPAAGIVLVWLGVIAGGSALTFFLLSPDTLFALLGKDPSLTGRTEIWDSLLRRYEERPWTGYGYAAFWGKESMPANWVRLETEWRVPSAHHGWLEVLIQLGRIGVFFVGAAYALAALLAVVRLPTQGVREGYFGIAFLTAFAVLTLSESVMMLHHNFAWALFVAVMASRFAPVRDEQPAVEARLARQTALRRSPRFRSVRPARHTA
jgi:O-antigen ligase